jgi:prolipoprotein diacylglyceryl transferase
MAIPYPQIDPVLISIGPIAIRWYSLAYLAGLAFAWWHMVRISLKDQSVITKTDIDDLISWGALGIVIGGRLGYVLFYNIEFFIENPKEIIALWKGGMSFHGGLIGVISVILFYTRKKKLNTLAVGDIIASATPIGLFFGRIANFINSELYGRIAPDVKWAIIFPNGGQFPRHPSQIYEALPEREPAELVFHAMHGLLNDLQEIAYGEDEFFYLQTYVLWEMVLLNALGFGLSLDKCAVTEQTDNLIYVSPKTGRAVSAKIGERWKNQLLDLPSFIAERAGVEGGEMSSNPIKEIISGLELTGYFLNKHAFSIGRMKFPQSRQRLVAKIAKIVEFQNIKKQ